MKDLWAPLGKGLEERELLLHWVYTGGNFKKVNTNSALGTSRKPLADYALFFFIWGVKSLRKATAVSKEPDKEDATLACVFSVPYLVSE